MHVKRGTRIQAITELGHEKMIFKQSVFGSFPSNGRWLHSYLTFGVRRMLK